MYNYQCDWKNSFATDPTKKPCSGYLLSFVGIGLVQSLMPDLSVYTPYPKGKTPLYTEAAKLLDGITGQIKCVGVIESFAWSGGVRDSICVTAYISAENAVQIKDLLKAGIKTTIVKGCKWWIINFDQESNSWYEASFPKNPANVTGQIAGGTADPQLNVDLNPNVANVYKFTFGIAPAGNLIYSLRFATSVKTSNALPWGYVVDGSATSSLVPG